MNTATLTDELTELRARIAALKAERDVLLDGPVPRQEFKARASAWVDRLAKEFNEDVRHRLTSFRGSGRHPLFPSDTTAALVARGRAHPRFEGQSEIDMGPMLCWLMGGEIKRKFAALIDSDDYQEGLGTAERPDALARLAADLDAAELREEELIGRADEAGLSIPRRDDVRPEIVLWPQTEESPGHE